MGSDARLQDSVQNGRGSEGKTVVCWHEQPLFKFSSCDCRSSLGYKALKRVFVVSDRRAITSAQNGWPTTKLFSSDPFGCSFS